ncbi:MAG: tRNA (adenosine(37)-N6)-threonylcarbamoyltransferase complex transferase subunit TsaD [Bacteroidetes bacterium RIFCSPLOWO2_12_FULL_35_15]|nr:MAG: tRNA (adenosine(37)-N6)-threonylcarbamoyltransferase complex transferase subunit TsaD [Bacteroidetes bacterium RIFCSPLOWO2_12_FULL_35_15]
MNNSQSIIILGIESSCDDTAAAVIKDGKLLANIVATQNIHKLYGGVVPELASRAHQQNIIPVVDQAIKSAGINKEDISAIAFTSGPGLMGSLLVGVSFSKAFAMGLHIPMIEVNHMQGHILAHFIETSTPTANSNTIPSFPFLCLTVSGGHTQIVLVKDHFDMAVIGETIDDAAGEAFDKAAKIMGLPYPGGPLIDKYAAEGNPKAYSFTKPQIQELNFSFSGLKTGFMNFITNETAKNPNFVEENKADICASLQATIIEILLLKLKKAAKQTNIKQIAIAGGVSANSGLRAALQNLEQELDWKVFIPKFEYCTDNAAMIAITGYYKYLIKDFASQTISPKARYALK